LRKLYLQPFFESLLMTCAKNCKNWWMCVKPIAGQTWDIFGDTLYMLSFNNSINDCHFEVEKSDKIILLTSY